MACRTLFFITILSTTAVVPRAEQDAPPMNPFFAYKNSMETAGPASVDDQVQILADLGFDGFENRGLDGLEGAVAAIEKRGMTLFSIYFRVNIDPGEEVFDPRLSDAAKLLEGHGTVLWCHTHSKRFQPSDTAGDECAIPIFQAMADAVAPYGVRVAPYPHINLWVESPEDTLRLAEKVDRPNFGVSFNLYHWKALGGKTQPLAVLAPKMAPRLLLLSINGSHGKDIAIGPLEQTEADAYFEVLKHFRDAGYAGPVGLQCYKVPGDPRDHLKKSMAVWRALAARFQP